MTNRKEFTVPDIVPTIIESVKFVLEGDFNPVADRDYERVIKGGNRIEGKIINGLIQEKDFRAGRRKIKLKSSDPNREESVEASPPQAVLEHDWPSGKLEPLPALDLRNRPDGTGPLQRGDHRGSLIEHLQLMLLTLGFPLGETGMRGDGVDGIFGEKTELAVKNFQSEHKDWEGHDLAKDGMVGPRTADALNRSLVGGWYDEYETPRTLTPDFRIITVTEKVAVERGIEL